MKKIMVLLPALLLLAAGSVYAADNCKVINDYYGLKCESKKDFKKGPKYADKKMQKKDMKKMHKKDCKCGNINKHYGHKKHVGKAYMGCNENINEFYGAKKECGCPKSCKGVKTERINEFYGAEKTVGCSCKPAVKATPKQPVKPAPAAPAKPTAREELSKVATVKTTEKGSRLSFNTPIVFDNNSDKLQAGSKPEVQKIARVLKNHPEAVTVVEGYSDSTGNAAYNVDLSERRAKTVADILVAEGVKEENVSYKGFGAANPIADNATREGRAKNRRVELNISNK